MDQFLITVMTKILIIIKTKSVSTLKSSERNVEHLNQRQSHLEQF